MRLLPVILASVLSAGCASYTALSAEEMSQLDRELTQAKQPRFLKGSFYVTPFFGDGTKRLLTAVPPEEVRLLNDTKGKPINPGPVEKILPAGTKVRIEKVEFPTALVATGRLLYTPRTQPWVYVDVPGDADTDSRPLIVVLRQGIKSDAEFQADLEESLTPIDPADQLAGFGDAVRTAIFEKRALVDMSKEALELAWGRPERIQVTYPSSGEGSSRVEAWTWPGGKRRAELVEGRVVRTEGGEPVAK